MSASADDCCYRSGARVTGVRFVAGIRVDDHHLGYVTADYRILPEARVHEKSNFRWPQWKRRGLGAGHHGMLRRDPGCGNP